MKGYKRLVRSCLPALLYTWTSLKIRAKPLIRLCEMGTVKYSTKVLIKLQCWDKRIRTWLQKSSINLVTNFESTLLNIAYQLYFPGTIGSTQGTNSK